MLKSLYHKITSPKKVIGIDINHTSDGNYQVFVIELTLEKNNISVTNKLTENTIEEVIIKLDKTIPVFINLSGKGVLTKKSTQENFSISKLLPNVNIADFYTQKTSSLLSVVRREVINEIVQPFQTQGTDIVGVSLNGLIVENMLGLFDDKHDRVEANSTYQLEEEKIISIILSNEIESKNVLIGGERLNSHYIVAYSLAFQELLYQVESIGIEENEITILGEEYKQKKLFKASLMGALGGILFLLLINFFLFSSFRNTNQELSAQLGMYEGQIKKIENLQKEVENKNNFLTKTGWLNRSKASYYSDQIGATVPKKIQLTQLQLNPVDKKKTKKQKETVFTTNIIHVSGSCKSSIELNKWIKTVKELDWVNNAEVLDYEQVEGSRNAEFIIEVTLN